MYFSYQHPSPIGTLMMASDSENIVGLWVEGQKYFGKTVNEPLVHDAHRSEFKDTAKWLDAYFYGENPPLTDVKLAPNGSEFQKCVWQELLNIPYGETTTYGEIGKKVAQIMQKHRIGGQAVGGAVGHNPVSIIIPCHRVVASSGSLTGYAGGLARKIQLLQLEGVNTGKFFVPKKGTAL